MPTPAFSEFTTLPALSCVNANLCFLVGGYLKKPLGDDDVKTASRYPINEFGIRPGLERSYRDWKAAREAGKLHTEYLGRKPVEELNNRPCYWVKRHCETPEEDGLTDIVLQFDAETLEGTSLRGHSAAVQELHFSADGKVLVSSSIASSNRSRGFRLNRLTRLF